MNHLLITAAVCAALLVGVVHAKPDYQAPPSSADALLAAHLDKPIAALLLLQYEAGYDGMTDAMAQSTAQSVRRLAYMCFVSADDECPADQLEKIGASR